MRNYCEKSLGNRDRTSERPKSTATKRTASETCIHRVQRKRIQPKRAHKSKMSSIKVPSKIIINPSEWAHLNSGCCNATKISTQNSCWLLKYLHLLLVCLWAMHPLFVHIRTINSLWMQSAVSVSSHMKRDGTHTLIHSLTRAEHRLAGLKQQSCTKYWIKTV